MSECDDIADVSKYPEVMTSCRHAHPPGSLPLGRMTSSGDAVSLYIRHRRYIRRKPLLLFGTFFTSYVKWKVCQK